MDVVLEYILMHSEELFELDFPCRITSLWSSLERLFPEICIRGRVRLKHSRTDATAQRAPQQKIDSLKRKTKPKNKLWFVPSIYPPIYNTPGIGLARDCSANNKASLLCVLYWPVLIIPGCTVDFSYGTFSTSGSCRWCYAAPVLSILHVTSCLPTFSLSEQVVIG